MSRFHNRNFELLEPYDAKVSCTVLRGERGSNTPDLPDNKISEDRKLKINYDEGVLARFKEYCTQGKRPLNTISGYLVMNNDYKSSYFYFYESVDVHK